MTIEMIRAYEAFGHDSQSYGGAFSPHKGLFLDLPDVSNQ